MVFPRETPDSTSRNKNLGSHPSSRKASSGDEVIDGTNAQTECFGGVTPGIEQLFDSSIHAQAPLLNLNSAFKQVSIRVAKSPHQSDRVAGICSVL